MNWEAIGATGELIGAAGVIISILYLAAQVRSNTRSLKASTFQAACDASARISLVLGSDPQVALVWQKGLAGAEELTTAEVAQFQYLFHSLLRQIENGHFQLQNGTMDQEIWLGWVESLRSILGSPGGTRVWPAFRPRMRPSFARFVEQEVLTSTSEAATANFLRARPDPKAEADPDAA